MSELEHPYIVRFPLKGEWTAGNTPAKKIPSHGTDQFGQRFAYDFYKIINNKIFDNATIQYYTIGVPTKNCYCWGANVYAVGEGVIVAAENNMKEGSRIQFILDLIRLLGRTLSIIAQAKRVGFENIDLSNVLGNYIIIKHKEYYSLYAHFLPGSVKVAQGQKVLEGECLGRVGHTGNSTAPHLHFQIMDSDKLTSAKGLPCAFSSYDVAQNNSWVTVNNGFPKHNEIIRVNE